VPLPVSGLRQEGCASKGYVAEGSSPREDTKDARGSLRRFEIDRSIDRSVIGARTLADTRRRPFVQERDSRRRERERETRIRQTGATGRRNGKSKRRAN